MTAQEQDPGGEHERNRENDRSISPRIYVASLSDYNNGHLHGAWLEAHQDLDDLYSGVEAMLRSSNEPGAEEFGIFDHEGFGPWRVSEYESLDTVATVAEGIATHGPAFAHWVEIVGGETDDLRGFEDAYLGHWKSVEAYAEDFAENVGLLETEQMPGAFSAYIHVDYEALGRDMELSGDITTSEGDGGVYVFSGVW